MQNPKNESSSHKDQQYWGSTGSSVVSGDLCVAAGSAHEGSAAVWCGGWHHKVGTLLQSTAQLPFSEAQGLLLRRQHCPCKKIRPVTKQ